MGEVVSITCKLERLAAWLAEALVNASPDELTAAGRRFVKKHLQD